MVQDRDLGPLVVGPCAGQLRASDLQSSLVAHAWKHVVQPNAAGARFKPRIRPPLNLVFALNLQTQHPFERQVKQGASQARFVRGERAALHANLKRSKVRTQVAFVGGAFPFHLPLGAVKALFQRAVLPRHVAHPGTVSLRQAHERASGAVHQRFSIRIGGHDEVSSSHVPRRGRGLKQQSRREEALGQRQKGLARLSLFGVLDEVVDLGVPRVPCAPVFS